MSKGSPYVPLRIPVELYERILAQMELTNLFVRDEEYNVSSWLRKAAEEKLAKMARSRRPRSKGDRQIQEMENGENRTGYAESQ